MAIILKHAWASRPSGEWRDDYDVLGDGGVVGRIMKAAAGGHVVDVDAGLWTS
jgi:hypothetical protein